MDYIDTITKKLNEESREFLKILFGIVLLMIQMSLRKRGKADREEPTKEKILRMIGWMVVGAPFATFMLHQTTSLNWTKSASGIAAGMIAVILVRGSIILGEDMIIMMNKIRKEKKEVEK